MLRLFLKRVFRRIKYLPKFLYESYTWECETCQECGNAFRIAWLVKDDIWKKVTDTDDGGGGSYCLDCFIKKAEKQGIKLHMDDLDLEPFYPEA